MTRLYLALSIAGFGIPLALAPWTLQHRDNLLFLMNPAETLELTFGNYASAAFTADLLWVFVVFCSWVIVESRSRGIKRSWVFILLAFLFGVSGPFPLFLYWRERQLAAAAAAGEFTAPCRRVAE